jgi:hypothetical protein
MSNLLVLGCSYSHLGHHIQYGIRYNSYTIQLKEQLGFNKLINLAIPGASPSTVNRILLQYLDNPVHGYPDFVFIQWPNANRNEYFTDVVSNKENVSYIADDGVIHLNWSEDKQPNFSNSTWASTTNGIDKSLINAHNKLYINKAQQLINLYKEVGIAEQYLGNLKIPYAYVESDELLCKDHYDVSAFNYAQHLCHKQFFIPGVGIQRNSPTYANDDYKDKHPGAKSHKRFAEAIIPKLTEILT